MRNIFAAFMSISLVTFSYAKEMYRAPSAGDSGTYYVLTYEKVEGDIVRVLTSRIGKGNEYTDFTDLKFNCASKQYFELAGGSEDGVKEIPSKPLKDWSGKSKWTPLVTGSSKYDLFQFICDK